MNYFILENNKLKQLKIKRNKYSEIKSNIIKKRITDHKWLIINSFKNLCLIIDDDNVEKDLYPIDISSFLETPNDELERFEESIDNSNQEYIIQNKFNSVTFVLTITYKCNLNCIYCYQQKFMNEKKEKMTIDTLDNILSIIKDFIVKNPNTNVNISLFGGEPLLKENENIIDIILNFCINNKLYLDITTNGVNLDYYLKKLIIYRACISNIATTIDSLKYNELTRCSNETDKNINSQSTKILNYAKILLNYGLSVSIGTNFDMRNIENMESIYSYFKEQNYLSFEKFTWFIGRVDDRLYETNYKYIIDEVDVLKKVSELNFKEPNIHIGILKTTYNLNKKINNLYNQQEIKGTFNYCWCDTPIDKVFYIDKNLNVFRCSYTVGRDNMKIGKFSLDFLNNYKLHKRNFTNVGDCRNCIIGGFCSGGCYLSYNSNKEKFCLEEKKVFFKYLNEYFIPYLMKNFIVGE